MGLLVHPLPANHVVEEGGQAVRYLVEEHRHSLLYATDGAWLLKPVWQALQARSGTTIVCDATHGETPGDWRILEHSSVDMIRLILRTLGQRGVADARAPVFLTRMAPALCAPHREMAARLAAEGLTPAPDGWVVPWGDG